jgi:hypothetical protein
MLKASSKSSPDVVSRNVVSPFDHSLSSAADRFAHIWNPDNMQLDSVASPLRFLENFHVSPAAQSRFKRKCFLSIYQSAHFTEEKLSSFERDSFRSQWRQFARDFVSIKEANHANARQKFVGESGFAAPLQPAMM